MHTTCWNRANMPSARVSKRGDCPAWNFDWQHFCVSTFLAATVRECVGVSACMWVVRVCALCLCVCISQSSIKLFVLFVLPFCFFFDYTFHLFKTQLLCQAECCRFFISPACRLPCFCPRSYPSSHSLSPAYTLLATFAVQLCCSF